MKKEKRRFEVDFNFEWTYGVEISKIRNDLDQLEKLGATEIEIETEQEWDFASISIKAFYNRIETDDEFNARVHEFKKRQDEQKRQDIELIERLKLKHNL